MPVQASSVATEALRLPKWVWFVAAAFVAAGSFSANPLLTPFATLLLVMFPALLWRADEPPVLVFACAMQWLQAASVVFYADAYGVSVTQIFGGPELELATWLSLVGVAVNAIGMRTILLRAPKNMSQRARCLAKHIKISNAFIFYAACFVVSTVAERFAFAVPSLAQPITAVASLKWVAIFVLIYSVIQQRNGYGFLVTAVVFEFGVGLLGYFASFKLVFFVLLVTMLTSATLRRKHLVVTAVVAAILIASGVVWSAVKQDYRDFLNQGTGEQQVLVPIEERGAKLTELLGAVSWDSIANGLDSLMLRVSQVSYFAYTTMNVPQTIPYADGALWLDAVKRVVTPRVLFPNKAEVNDSERTNLYTGLGVAGSGQGTSIGIGYIAESYVDFGPVYMFVPIFFLGVFYGFIYRLFVFSREPLLGYGIAVAILALGAYTIETSNIKLVGGNTTALLILGSLYLLFRRAFMHWLTFDPHR